MEIVRVENLSFMYVGTGEASEAEMRGKAAKTAADSTDKAGYVQRRTLEDVSFTLEKGELLCICGPTGSGKTTLLRMLKKELTPAGKREGKLYLAGRDIDMLSERESAAKIGFVTQRPEQQIVMDKVWHELAFGLENLGMPRDMIRRRVAEIACFFGIESWFDRNTDELSGGQKQLLNLASVMVMQPEVLILDEPSAQLDPIAASEFLASVLRLKRELGLTVIMAEHRLEDVVPVSDKLLVLENGRITAFGPVRECLRGLDADSLAMPAAVRLHKALNGAETQIPLSIAEGRAFLEKYCENRQERAVKTDTDTGKAAHALEFNDVFVRYTRDSKDALSGTSFSVCEGEIFCIMGGNGAGKSTAVAAAAGLIRPYSGQIKVFGKKLKDYRGPELYRNCVAMLPQDVQTVFVQDEINGRHPYDLSGGEQQLAALEIVLATKPRLLLLDEPTKGLDVHTTSKLAERLKNLAKTGVTVVIVTHDVEFAAIVADRCALMFNGEITSCDKKTTFFNENYFYTTVANRMSRGLIDGALTVGEIAERLL
jgi:energy-coupling factor transport system ATP-binding protein